MLKKLIRGIVTMLGCALGYGVFVMLQFVYELSGSSLADVFTPMQLAATGACFAIIFGIIFFRIAPAVGKHSKHVARSIESDLQSVPTNDIVSGTFGLIVGLVIAFLVSQVYAGIQFMYLGTALTIITYVILGYLGVVISTKRLKDFSAA